MIATLFLLAQSSVEQSVSDALGAAQPITEYVGTIAFGISGALVAGRSASTLRESWSWASWLRSAAEPSGTSSLGTCRCSG